jgi:hypothetical protein
LVTWIQIIHESFVNSLGYGQAVSPTDILIRRTVSNPQVSGLMQAITKAAGK